MSRTCACTATTSLFDLCPACYERATREACDQNKAARENPERGWTQEHDLSTSGAKLRPGT